MAILTVGTGEQFATIAAAVAASQDGDTVEVAAGTYINDFTTFNTKITIEGVGGMVNVIATVPPPDGKAIFTTNTDVTMFNIELSGATVADGNGAGIRYQGGNLTLNHVFIHDNQDGLLGAPDPTGTITVIDSEFANNGSGTGQTHNIYVGEIATFTTMGSYYHDANVGHEIKTRALVNNIEGNRIASGSASDSYEIDLPNGGVNTVTNNIIEKGPNSQNFNWISFGEEGPYAGSTLNVSGNTLLNGLGAGFLVHDLVGGSSVSITNNQSFNLGANQLYSGSGSPSISGGTTLTNEPALDTSSPWNPPLVFNFPCFVKGTMILTDRGEVGVESLQIGDLVAVRAGFMPVKWIGYRRLNLAFHPAPGLARPIRFKKHAIRRDVPSRDLLLSPDHAVFIDDMLIGARQLVNGMTIHQDARMPVVEYYHVELDQHDILISDGLTTESYLDTGNATFFENSNVPVTLHPDMTAMVQMRLERSCAPFGISETMVKPIWQRLTERAIVMGHVKDVRSTIDPDFRLMIGHQSIRPMGTEDHRYTFMLPAGTKSVRLVSRAAMPTDARPWLDDSRRLGILVNRVTVRHGSDVTNIPMDHPALRDGWWAVERYGELIARWTNGEAVLSIPGSVRGQIILEIQTGGEMVYPVATAA